MYLRWGLPRVLRVWGAQARMSFYETSMMCSPFYNLQVRYRVFYYRSYVGGGHGATWMLPL